MSNLKDILDGRAKFSGGSYRSILSICMAETLGTAILLFIGCMGCIVNIYDNVVPQFAPFTFGLAVAIAVQMFGHISGGHFNPCVTIAAKIMNKIEWNQMPFYFVSQLIGAFAGYGLIMLVTPIELNAGLCVTSIHSSIQPQHGLVIETVITAILILMCCAVWDSRLSAQSDSVSIRLGLMLSGVFLATSQFTGASINPIRSLVPAVYQNSWEAHWVYWVGPSVGAVAAAFIYKYSFPEKATS